ncbi:MAG: cupin domain-containing protein [Candidatus Thorarchaeota archaeon]|jgi:mannose-6-phosphate isomerase-like protein (cupin superfamily)
MGFEARYNIDTKIQFGPMEVIDFPRLIVGCQEQWQNLALCQVNDSVIRLGVIQGEFHWHKHDLEDEFFYVIDGHLVIDLEDRTVELKPREGFVVPRGITHRTRAPERTSILMVEGSTVTPTGD